jgi:S1-C subfamily serine protease
VLSVVPGAPADGGGVQPGDVIVGVGGTSIKIPDDIRTAIEKHKPGDRIDIEVQRGTARKTLKVSLGIRPENVPGSSPSTGAVPGIP